MFIYLRGGVKKWVFFTFGQKTETPFLTTSVFSDKDLLDWARPPPPINEKNGQKQFFYASPYYKNSAIL